MKLRANRVFRFVLSLSLAGVLMSSVAVAQQEFVIKPIAEKKLMQLPAGPLYWLVENFPTLQQAQAAAGPTSLAVGAEGKAWLFTLGAKNGPSHGDSKVAEIGPVPAVTAPEYLLRINHVNAPPGAKTQAHTHPGSETFYVLAGQLTQKTPRGVRDVRAGEVLAGRAPGITMQVSSSGTNELHAFVMFVVDATKPFSSPAKF